jgi:2C-methyl-D-erythritol 2,4-cyclodiphosphate synthase
MAEILKFIRPTDSFDPETLAILGTVYDRAVASLNGHSQSDAVRSTVADRIMTAASRGERDVDLLYKAALRGIA